MIVTYSPEDGSEPRTWTWEPRRTRSTEQVIVEKQYGSSWSEFVAACKGNQAQARRVLLWHLIRRDHPALPFRDVPDFLDCELVIEQSLAELLENYEVWLKAGGPGNENGDMIGAMFEAEIAAAREREGVAKDEMPAGKAL